MLQSLSISNFILIDRLEVTFKSGFTTVTGETGAGKSVFVGALSMLLGRRADTGLIRRGKDKCIIEGFFTDLPEKVREIIQENELEEGDEGSCTIRREMSTNGRNRCFINDTPVQLATLASISEHLIDIHSQHRNLLLGDADYILTAIDRMLSSTKPKEEYQVSFQKFLVAKKRLEELKEELRHAEEDFDYDSFRFDELSKAGLSEGEEDRIIEEEKILRHAEEIKSILEETEGLFGHDEVGILRRLSVLQRILIPLKEHLPEVADYIVRIDSSQIELGDIASDLARRAEDIEINPRKLAEIEERIDLLNRLFEKYRSTTSTELITLRDELGKKIALFQDSGNALHVAEENYRLEKAKLEATGEKLSAIRSKAGEEIALRIEEGLRLLEIPDASVAFNIENLGEPKPSGYDRVTFLFSANRTLHPKPVGEIASGGEMARLMLSLKALLAEKESLPTILFDEIDNGISGRVADRMGLILRRMGAVMQVIAITHLPQIAARSTQQMCIEKVFPEGGEPATVLRQLSDEERQAEIARLLSGDTITKASLEAAKELLQNK